MNLFTNYERMVMYKRKPVIAYETNESENKAKIMFLGGKEMEVRMDELYPISKRTYDRTIKKVRGIL